MKHFLCCIHLHETLRDDFFSPLNSRCSHIVFKFLAFESNSFPSFPPTHLLILSSFTRQSDKFIIGAGRSSGSFSVNMTTFCFTIISKPPHIRCTICGCETLKTLLLLLLDKLLMVKVFGFSETAITVNPDKSLRQNDEMIENDKLSFFYRDIKMEFIINYIIISVRFIIIKPLRHFFDPKTNSNAQWNVFGINKTTTDFHMNQRQRSNLLQSVGIPRE